MSSLSVMPKVAAALGGRIDVPFRDLTDHERAIVLDGLVQKSQFREPSRSGKLST